MAGFHWADYLVCALSLMIGPLLSLIFAFTGGRQKTTDEYLLGNKAMNPITVGASMLVSGLNAVFLLGGTAEVYYRGAIYGLMFLANFSVAAIVCLFFIPSWRKVEVTSAYELCFMPLVLYAPAMALSQVVGLNIHVSILVCGVLCAFYTCMGGIKAVVWTDTVQAVIVVIGMLVINIYGTIASGGLEHLIHTAREKGRFNFNNLSFHPSERHTVWSTTIGYSFVWMTLYLSDQTIVQRYQSVKSVSAARWAIVVRTLLSVTIELIVVTAGVVAAVYFEDCDPLLNGDISKGDQLLPFLFMSLLGPYHGLKGLFIASIFAAALSTVSSAINSCTAVYLEDVFKPLFIYLGRPIQKSREHIHAKVLSGILGVIAIGLSYLAPLMGPVIIQIPPTLMGVLGGPLFSLFFLGFYVPFANKWGALVGSFTGIVFGFWAGIGALLYGRPPTEYNLPVGLCHSNHTDNYTSVFIDGTFNDTLPNENDLNSAYTQYSLSWLYNLSYIWICLIAQIISVGLGVIVSVLTNIICKANRRETTEGNLQLQEKKAFLS